MPYIEQKPSLTLAPYVDSFWLSQNGSIPKVNRILPDGCVDILFPFEGRILSTCAGQTQTLKPGETYVVGTMTTFADVTLPEGASMAGIRFKPLGFSAFFGLPLDGLENGLAEFSELRVPVLFDQPNDFPDTVRLLEEQLYQRIKPTDPRIQRVVDLIRLSGGTIKIDTLVEASCLSIRQFEKNFRQQLGVSAKALCDVIRIKKCADRLRNSREDLAKISFDQGYYDAAHFSNTFKRYVGQTPNQYRAK